MLTSMSCCVTSKGGVEPFIATSKLLHWPHFYQVKMKPQRAQIWRANEMMMLMVRLEE